MLKSIFNWFIVCKVYISRASSYIALLNTGMLLFLFLSNLKSKGIINIDLEKWFFPLFILTFILFFIIGWLDIRFLKTNQKENEFIFPLNPPMVELKNKIDKIYDIIKNDN